MIVLMGFVFLRGDLGTAYANLWRHIRIRLMYRVLVSSHVNFIGGVSLLLAFVIQS
jgi:hypothetical protein